MSLRDPHQVARRTLVLITLAFRGSLETVRQTKAVELSVQLLPWLREQKLEDELDPRERKILETSFGRLSPSQLNDLRIAGEPVAWFAWALERGERPQPQKWADAMPWITKLAIERPEALALLDAPQLRDETELAAAARESAAVATALRQARLTERPLGLMTAAKDLLARQKREQWSPLGIEISDADLSAAAETVAALPVEQQKQLGRLTFVRELALSWLFDRRPSYYADTAAADDATDAGAPASP